VSLSASLVWLLLAADPTGFIGTVRVVGSAPNRQVVLTANGKDTPITGALVDELSHLAGVRVELLGYREKRALRMEGYRILDVGNGVRPLVGILQELPGGGMALGGDSGEPVPLSLDAATRRHLGPKAGAKIWVSGKKLLSGELRVARWGLLSRGD